MSSSIPLRHKVMILIGQHMQRAGVWRAAAHQIRAAKWHAHMNRYMANAASSSGYVRATPVSSAATPSTSSSGLHNGMDWSWKSSSWCNKPNAADCSAPSRGWHHWAGNYGAYPYGGRYDCWSRGWGWGRWGRWSHGRHGRHWTPEQQAQWEEAHKKWAMKAAEWSTWAARWGEEVAAATQRTASEYAAAQASRPAASSSASSSASSWWSSAANRYGRYHSEVTIREQPSQYLVEVATPGVAREQIKITVADGHLTITSRPATSSAASASESVATSTAAAEGASSTTSSSTAASEGVASSGVEEIHYGSIELPADVNTSAIRAHYSNGMLTMSLPKRITPVTDIPIQS